MPRGTGELNVWGVCWRWEDFFEVSPGGRGKLTASNGGWVLLEEVVRTRFDQGSFRAIQYELDGLRQLPSCPPSRHGNGGWPGGCEHVCTNICTDTMTIYVGK